MTSIGTLKNKSIDTLRDVLTRLEKEGSAVGHFNVADQVLLKLDDQSRNRRSGADSRADRFTLRAFQLTRRSRLC